MNKDKISCLILQELKLIRKEMKEEIRRLCKSIQFFHFDKTNENVFDSIQDFSRNEENSLHFSSSLTNHSNGVIVRAELIPDSTESFRKCEGNFYAEQCESSSLDNFKSDNLKVGFQLEEIELPTDNDNNLKVREIIKQENLCETPEPVIVDVKSMCESKNDSDELNCDVYSSLFEISEKARKAISNKNSTITDFVCKENDYEILLKPVNSFMLDQNNITHKISRKSIGNFSCIKCFQSFSNSSDYNRHIKAHTDNETQSGDESEQHNDSTHILSNMNRNLLSGVNHLDKRKMNVCKICNKTFSTNSNLKTHMRIHVGENLHTCNTCCKSFSIKANLIRHIRIHTGEKPYQCNICSRRFTNKWHLHRHIRIHTGEKPYKCSICDKRFNRKDQMVVHTRFHSREKLFKCKICNKKFEANSSLVRHSRIHI